MTQDQPNRQDTISVAIAQLTQLHIETRQDLNRSIVALTDFSIRQAQRIDEHDATLARIEQLTEQNALASQRHDEALSRLEEQNRQMNERMDQGFEQLRNNINQLALSRLARKNIAM